MGKLNFVVVWSGGMERRGQCAGLAGDIQRRGASVPSSRAGKATDLDVLGMLSVQSIGPHRILFGSRSKAVGRGGDLTERAGGPRHGR